MGNLESRGSMDGFDLNGLSIDEALVRVDNKMNRHLHLFTNSADCVKCTPTYHGLIGKNLTLKVDTKFESTFYLTEQLPSIPQFENIDHLCSVTEHFGEFGVYNLDVSGKNNCTTNTLKEPVNIYIPLVIYLFGSIGVAILWFLGCALYNFYSGKRKKTDQLELSGDSVQTAEEENPKPKKERLKSIDTFRGISIVIMIFVNNGGGRYYFFDHATWDGLFVADLVFPWFLWVMGVCIPMSLRSSLARTTKRQTFVRIFRRTIWLFLLGLILGSGSKIATLRVVGVLQRFAITYFIVANLALVFSGWFEKEFQNKRFRDIIRLIPHWTVIICILIAHCVIVFAMEVPGCPTGYLGPGGLHLYSAYPNCTGGSYGYVDRLILGSHIYAKSAYKTVYNTHLAFDPEGIVSTLTSVIQVFLGVQAGSILLTWTSVKDRVLRWVSWGVLTGILAAILCKGSMSDGWIPVNKNLWSLSFVLVTCSFAFLLLSLCYVVIDVFGIWSGVPFYYPGMNSIILYCGHSLTYSLFPFVWEPAQVGSHALALTINLWTTSVWVVISVWLHSIGFFLAL